MRLERLFLAIGFITLIFFSVISCVSAGAIQANSTTEIPTIQQKYPDRFERTRVGMSLNDFRQIWPEAIKTSETQEYVIYEFRDSTEYYTDHDRNIGVWWTGSIRTREFIQYQLFYFTDDILVKYEYRPGVI